jgi:nitronate monooxygenase
MPLMARRHDMNDKQRAPLDPSRLADRLPGAARLRLPIIAAPMFLLSSPHLVVAECRAGLIGSFPALNARTTAILDEWLATIATAASATAHTRTPFAVNLVVHESNPRLEADLAVCANHRVPIIITSLQPPERVVARVHAYGGLVLHDVTTVRHARKAIQQGVDGLIAVAAGAGGHAGTRSPFALVRELRALTDGLLVLGGALSTGGDVLAARAAGADLAYMGTRFIATAEAEASLEFKEMIVRASSDDIVYTPYFSGVSGNFLRESIQRAGLDADRLGQAQGRSLEISKESESRAWRDIWSAGHGVGVITDIPTVGDLVDRLEREFAAAQVSAAWR